MQNNFKIIIFDVKYFNPSQITSQTVINVLTYL